MGQLINCRQISQTFIYLKYEKILTNKLKNLVYKQKWKLSYWSQIFYSKSQNFKRKLSYQSQIQLQKPEARQGVRKARWFGKASGFCITDETQITDDVNNAELDFRKALLALTCGPDPFDAEYSDFYNNYF